MERKSNLNAVQFELNAVQFVFLRKRGPVSSIGHDRPAPGSAAPRSASGPATSDPTTFPAAPGPATSGPGASQTSAGATAASGDRSTSGARSPRRSSATDIALIAGFAALIAACALLPAITVAGPVPITLQTFAVLLAGAVLGPVRGFLAVLLYIAAGAAGLPIFSGGAAGIAVLQGPTAGYLAGMPLAAALCGFLVSRLPRRKLQSIPLIFLAGLLGSIVFNHSLGIVGLHLRAGLSWSEAFKVDIVFWPGDVIKNLLMAIVATAVHRAFPDIMGRKVSREPARESVTA